MKDPRQLTAQDIMVSPVQCAETHETLEHLEQRMLEDRVSAMPVVEDGKLLGFISKTDLVRLTVVQDAMNGYIEGRWTEIGPGKQEAVEEEPAEIHFDPLTELLVRDAMRSGVITCTPQTPVNEIAAKIVQNKIHHIVVVDGENVAGIISTLDLAELLVD